MNGCDSLKLDKTTVTIAPLTDKPDDVEYWRTQSPYARLQAVETLRQLNYGRRQSAARLQRVLEVTQRALR